MPYHAPDHQTWQAPDLPPDEPGDDGPELGPGQFRLRSLFVLTFVVAVFFSMVAWWGPFIVALVVGGAVGTFGGMLFCLFFGLETPFEVLKLDVARCLMVSIVLVGCAYGAIALVPAPRVLILPGLVAYFVIRLTWIDLGAVEAVVIETGTIVGIGLSAAAVAAIVA